MNQLTKEEIVKAYYSGFEKHEWNAVAELLADDFTFTSANNDDHISVDEFKKRCWGTSTFIKKVNHLKMTESGNDLILLVEIITTDNTVVRNVDIFTIAVGKIKSVEVFFGLGESFPGNKK
ncbi:MAG: nuclear transport factor 2 family protein [Bacteroidia bacterium]